MKFLEWSEIICGLYSCVTRVWWNYIFRENCFSFFDCSSKTVKKVEILRLHFCCKFSANFRNVAKYRRLDEYSNGYRNYMKDINTLNLQEQITTSITKYPLSDMLWIVWVEESISMNWIFNSIKKLSMAKYPLSD